MQFKSRVESIIALKQEKEAIDEQLKAYQYELTIELLNHCPECLSINWNKVYRRAGVVPPKRRS